MTGERIYHYTTMDAFLHLLESTNSSNGNLVFWASNIFFMNDPQEFVYGLNILKEIIEELDYENTTPDYYISNLWKKFDENETREWQKKLIEDIYRNRESPYVISFSRLRDSLPMWTQYGGQGKGVCLVMPECRYEFKGIDIKDPQIETYDSLNVYNIAYDIKEFKESNKVLYKAVKDICENHYYSKIKSFNREEQLKLCNEIVKSLMILVSPYLKSLEYRGEREVRISKTIKYELNDDVNKVKFRTNGRGNIIPYVEIEIQKEQIDEVIIGPLANYELSYKALEMMKQKYDMHFNIIHSDVQYREY